jgi:hypothetical protein
MSSSKSQADGSGLGLSRPHRHPSYYRRQDGLETRGYGFLAVNIEQSLTPFPQYSPSQTSETRMTHLSDLLNTIVAGEVKLLYTQLLHRFRIVFFYAWFVQEVKLLAGTYTLFFVQCLWNRAEFEDEPLSYVEANLPFVSKIVCLTDCDNSSVVHRHSKKGMMAKIRQYERRYRIQNEIAWASSSANSTLMLFNPHSKRFLPRSISTVTKSSRQCSSSGIRLPSFCC